MSLVALTQPGSIFTATGGNKSTTAALSTDFATASKKYASVTAPDAISKGDKLLLSGATDAELLQAFRGSGLAKDYLQEEITNLAHVDYEGYLNVKRAALDKIKAEVMRAYLAHYKGLIDIGIPEREAEDAAKVVAKTTKEAQMEIFNIIFPESRKGAEVKKVF